MFVSLFAYFLAYNFEIVEFLGIDPVATQRAVFGGLGLGKQLIGKDGRQPPGWRDALEMDVYGDWKWDENHTALEPKVMEIFGANWHGKKDTNSELSVNDALQTWGEDIPQTQVLKHAPGEFSSSVRIYYFF